MSARAGRKGEARDGRRAGAAAGRDPLQFVRDVLDHEVVDAHQVPCGVVDDIEMEIQPGKGMRPVALLIGPGAWQRRLAPWMAAIARRIAGSREVRIPWSAIAYIDERVALRGVAADFGLDAADRKWGKRLARLPGG
jgi:sporulation protein YlmC with PRC-barrel domain